MGAGQRDPAERVGFLRGGARPPVPLICQYIDQRKEEFGVEPICTVLTESGCKIAPSTYYAARSRPPSKRSISDAAVDERILALRDEPFNATLGSRKTWRLLNTRQEGPGVARCTVERRMRALGLTGAGPGRTVRATGPAEGDRAPGDLLRRDFTATGPNRRWVVDFTHVPTWSGFCYTAFVMDLFSRRIVGWATSSRMDTDFVLGALEQAIWQRKERGGADLEGLVHHCDRGSKSPVHRLHRTTRRRGHRGIGRSRGFLLRQRRRRGPGQVLQARARLARRPLEGPRRPRDRDRQMGELVQPHPTPPHQPRRPPTHNRRTPLQSQPHHHPTHHRITNPPQNPGLSRRVWSVCANGAGVVGVWAEDLLGRCIEHCR